MWSRVFHRTRKICIHCAPLTQRSSKKYKKVQRNYLKKCFVYISLIHSTHVIWLHYCCKMFWKSLAFGNIHQQLLTFTNIFDILMAHHHFQHWTAGVYASKTNCWSPQAQKQALNFFTVPWEITCTQRPKFH